MSNKAIELLYLAKQNGIDILLAEDQLKVRFPKNKDFDKDLLTQIKDNKSLLVEFLKESKKLSNVNNKISKAERDADSRIPLSFSQERLWFVDSLEGSQQYHIPAVFRLKGKLNKEALQYSLKTIINRHEVLRTVYLEEDGEPYQKIIDADEWTLPETDGSEHKNDPEWIQNQIQQLIKISFDLTKDYMLRASLIRLDEEDSILVVVLHHIAADGWSISVLVKEVAAIYSSYDNSSEPELEPLNIQYADYAVWQRKYLQGETLENKLSYWKDKLEGLTPLELPADFPRPAIQNNRGSVVPFKIEKSLTSELKSLSQQNESTLFMTLLAALNVLLSRYSNQSDVCIGTGTAGRKQQELDSLIGFFINTVALRNDIRPDISFGDLLKQVRKNTLNDFEQQDVPFEKIVEAVEMKRDRSRHPIFQVMFVYQNTPDIPVFRLGDLQLSSESFKHTTSLFDLSFAITESNDGMTGSMEYNTDLFTEGTIKRMLNHFQILLSSIVKDPNQKIIYLPMMTKEEENQILIEFNKTDTDYHNDKSIVEVFEEQAAKTPNAIALTFEDQSLTYEKLNERANQLGHYLRSRGVREEVPVAVCVERSLELITGILGILKAGGAYVPVDADFPEERIQFMLDDAATEIIITSKTLKSKLPVTGNTDLLILDENIPDLSSQPRSNPGSYVKPDNLAYVIYTSGSTGKPKGVMVTQRNVVSLVKGVNFVSLKESDVLLSTGSSSFDATTIEYWGMLLNGGQLVLCKEKNLLESELLKKEIVNKKVNLMWFTSSWFNELIETDITIFKTLETVLAGGEKLSEYHIEKLRQTYPDIEIINGYGPTENTTFSLTYKITEKHLKRNIPIGRPLNNRKAYILDENKKPVPVGVAGEIYLSGAGLSRGYLNNPELTEERFVANPFSGEPTSRMYKTGDLGCWLPNGNVEYLGRKDEQVKIRGYRIELGEIENVLQECDVVSQGAVIVKEDEDGNKNLIAYVIPGENYDRNAVLIFLRAKLPDYMVPALWMEVERFTLTPNGKIDKRSLPEIDGDERLRNIYVAPRNETEEKLAAIWERVLGLEKVGVEDNFFELGGHSLLAMRLISAIRKELNAEVEVKELFANPVISELSNHILQQSNTSLLPAIEVLEERPEDIPLSFSQERLWFIDQLEGSLEYHLPTVLRLKGNLNVEALTYSLRQIINRHEVLRTVIHERDGQGYQHVIDAGNWNFKIIDGSDFKKDEEGLKQFIQNLINHPFDLKKDFMLRAELIRIDESENIFVVTMHHIASDAWSIPIIVKEVMELYSSYIENRKDELLPLRLQYSDYAIWQRKYLYGEELEKKLSYWKEKLGEATTLQLPTDFSRPAVRNNRGAFEFFKVDKELTDRLHELSQQYGSTLYMILLSAFKVLLYRYTGQKDITVGTSITNRPQQELEDLIGFFVNTLALHTEVNGDSSFSELLDKVKSTTLEAYAHQDVPFEKIVDAVVKERDQSRSPLFQVMLVLHNTPEVSKLRLGDLELSVDAVDSDVSKFEMTFFFDETPKGLIGTVQYRTDLFTHQTIRKMTNHFNELLKSIVKEPDQKIGKLQMLADDEKLKLTNEINSSEVIYPKEKSVVDLFEEQVMKTPDATALVFENEKLSYKELNERSNQLAHHLRSKGVKEETLVMLYAERGTGMMIGMLGIMKSGAAYVPVDTDFPQERIRYMLEDTGALIIVCSKEIKSKLANTENADIVEIEKVTGESKDNLKIKVEPHQLAYVIYTSGSTGKPKGVMIEHRSLVDYVFGLNEKIKINESSSFALVSTIATDLGNTVIYSSLLTGGVLHLFTKESVSNIEYIHRYFDEHRIDCLKIVPSHWKALMNDEKLLLPAKVLVFGGEILQSEMIEKIRQTGTECAVVNHYGPTETTIGKLLHKVEPEINYINTIPIGKLFSNTKVYVLSKENELCPTGVPGQLFISGDGLARGYYSNEELTKEKFIHNPFTKDEKSLMYGTGDLVKYLPDGNILFIGRADDQVKIRGYRIELGEIENILQQSELVNQAVVLAKEDKQGNKRLTGYITVQKESDKEFDKNEVTVWLKEKLPDYMIPSMIVVLEQFPLTANGKIDKNALPDPEASEVLSEGYTAPGNEAERKLTEIWREILEVDQIGIHDDFFELGGHSLLAVRLVSAIRKAFNVEMPIGDIFDFPTIALLSTQLEIQSEATVLPAIEVMLPRPERIPLSFSQERLWFIDQLDGSVQYNVPSVLRLKGKLNTEALVYSLKSIIMRHEILRTVIRENEGVGYQYIKDGEDWDLEIIDGIKYKEDLESLREYLKQLINIPFKLSEDYMLRGYLIRMSEEEHILAVTLHHIASDGWSTSIIVNDLVELYESYETGRESKLKPLPIQYADYAIWQRNYLHSELLDKKLDYWKNKLRDVEPLKLPVDFKRPPVRSIKGAILGFRIDKDLTEKLAKLSHQNGTTFFMTLLAAYKILLARYSGQSDIIVGTPIAGRQQQELEGMIGFFVNTLALRSNINSDITFLDLLQQVRVTTMESYEHQDLPFEKVVDALVGDRDMGTNPLVQVTFTFQNTPEIPHVQLGKVSLAREGYEHTTSKFDLMLFLSESSNGLEGSVEYSTDLYREQTIIQMMTHFKELLQSIVSNPEQRIGKLKMMPDSEIQQLLSGYSSADVNFPENKTIVDLFEEQVLRTPDSIALVFENKQLTYKELNERSNQLANYLIDKGVKTETLVPICIEKSFEMIIGIFGILKAGGVYVPIDPDYPIERINYILEDLDTKIVLSSKVSSSKLAISEDFEILETDKIQSVLSKLPSENLQVSIDPHNTAYVIYTSGSTGKPKGVMIEHYNVIRLFKTDAPLFDFNENDVWAMFHSFCFDFSVWEMYGALFYGGKLVIVPKDVSKDASLFAELILTEKVTVLNQTPSAFYVLQDLILDKSSSVSVRYVIFGGEALNPSKLYRWKQTFTECKLVNMYGITETTVHVTYQDIEMEQIQSGASVIGKPIPTLSAYILDSEMNLTPVGVPGELYIGGAGLARGYLNRPELTKERFIANPFGKRGEERLYKTGDLGRWLHNGSLEYLGRADDQVKIRGFRIELGEIETALNKLQPVSSCCVVERTGQVSNKLIGYYVLNSDVVRSKENELYIRQVESWKELYEKQYSETDEDSVNEEFNIIGWNDSFTGTAIPPEQMEEWLDDIIKVILNEKPERVLEIGCGTGLIYFKLADKIKKYTGTDFSRSSVNQINQRINKRLREYCSTDLQVCAAHEVSIDRKEPVDTIILNSIVQYFPGEKYMSEVIENCISLLDGKGRIIIGDVRDNRLLKLFKGRLNLQKLQHSVTLKEFKWITDQDILKEEELCFSPEYFYWLKSLYPEITHVEIKWKQGESINELTLYRFTVTIHVGLEKETVEPNWLDWKDFEKKQSIFDQLENDCSMLALKNVPNPRLWKEMIINNSLNDRSINTIGELLSKTEKEDKESKEVYEILKLAKSRNYSYRLFLNEDPLKVNILAEQNPSDGFVTQPSGQTTSADNITYTNIPLFNDISTILKKDIRIMLMQSLPDYMVPSDLIAVNQLPLTDNGKVDRKFLREREDLLISNKNNYQASVTEVEIMLSKIWQELLEVERVGIHDNFFELGGHSLLALRLFSYIEKITGRKLALSTLFNSPTISGLVSILEKDEWLPKWKSLVAVRPTGSKLPLFYVPPASGTALAFQKLLKYMPSDQPVYVLEPIGIDGVEQPHTDIKEMATFYVKEIQSLQPEGPYILAGRCFGGRVAFEMAQQLRRSGQKIALLAIFDTWPPYNKLPDVQEVQKRDLNHFVNRFWYHMKTGQMLGVAKNFSRITYLKTKRVIKNKLEYIFSDSSKRVFKTILQIHVKAQDRYVGVSYPGKITVIECGTYRIQNREGWKSLALEGFESYTVPGTTHETIMEEPHIKQFAEKFNFILEKTHKELENNLQANGKAKFYPRNNIKNIVNKLHTNGDNGNKYVGKEQKKDN